MGTAISRVLLLYFLDGILGLLDDLLMGLDLPLHLLDLDPLHVLPVLQLPQFILKHNDLPFSLGYLLLLFNDHTSQLGPVAPVVLGTPVDHLRTALVCPCASFAILIFMFVHELLAAGVIFAAVPHYII